MEILAQFLLRLAFGMAFGMAITSSRQVSSGYFRNHLYVTLGLATLAALVLAQLASPAAWLAALAAVLSFFGAACWLYEAKRAGRVALWLVALCGFIAALVAPFAADIYGAIAIWRSIAVVTSGLVLGLTLAAMLLGHWYLNAPGMELAPLRRLLAAAALAVGAQAVLSGVGVAMIAASDMQLTTAWLLFIVLRWSFGLIGVLALLWMAWKTLDIPNTQSATGLLYVAVLGVFVGELAAALLSAESPFPV